MGWELDGTDVATSSFGMKEPRKVSFFSEEQEDSTAMDSNASSRRKLNGRQQVHVLEEMEEDTVDVRHIQLSKASSTPAPSTAALKDKSAVNVASSSFSSSSMLQSSFNDKMDELAPAAIVSRATVAATSASSAIAISLASEANGVSTSSFLSTSGSSGCSGRDALVEECYVYEVVREYLCGRNHLDVVKLLDQEHPSLRRINDKQLGDFHHNLLIKTSRDMRLADSLAPFTKLEQFLIQWNQITHDRTFHHKKRKSTKSKLQSSASSSSEGSSKSRSKKKPGLHVITADLPDPDDPQQQAQDPPDGLSRTQAEYNTTGNPGSTPKQPQSEQDFLEELLGVPGSTPRPRTVDLIAVGMLNSEDETKGPVPKANVEPTTLSESGNKPVAKPMVRKGSLVTSFSRPLSKSRKQVHFGDPVNIPTKEYVFFRDTPPSFVTETIEEATEIAAKIADDPRFAVALEETEPPDMPTTREGEADDDDDDDEGEEDDNRYVELTSSNVSKYTIGQEVKGLGPSHNVTGVVTKICGSCQCGTSGPGTIVIDTAFPRPPTPVLTTKDNTEANRQQTMPKAMPVVPLPPQIFAVTTSSSNGVLDDTDEALMEELLAAKPTR